MLLLLQRLRDRNDSFICCGATLSSAGNQQPSSAIRPAAVRTVFRSSELLPPLTVSNLVNISIYRRSCRHRIVVAAALFTSVVPL
jgi:ABC-type lipoprotein export system ATPase subunit